MSACEPSFWGAVVSGAQRTNSLTRLQLKETAAGQEYLSSLEKWKIFALKYGIGLDTV